MRKSAMWPQASKVVLKDSTDVGSITHCSSWFHFGIVLEKKVFSIDRWSYCTVQFCSSGYWWFVVLCSCYFQIHFIFILMVSVPVVCMIWLVLWIRRLLWPVLTPPPPCFILIRKSVIILIYVYIVIKNKYWDYFLILGLLSIPLSTDDISTCQV